MGGPLFTFFDLDHATKNHKITSSTCSETIQFPGDQMIKAHGTETDQMSVYTARDGTVTVTAKQFGKKIDNPVDPKQLTQHMRNKSIGVEAKTTAIEFYA